MELFDKYERWDLSPFGSIEIQIREIRHKWRTVVCLDNAVKRDKPLPDKRNWFARNLGYPAPLELKYQYKYPNEREWKMAAYKIHNEYLQNPNIECRVVFYHSMSLRGEEFTRCTVL